MNNLGLTKNIDNVEKEIPFLMELLDTIEFQSKWNTHLKILERKDYSYTNM